jgi:ankyrin repeat protein
VTPAWRAALLAGDVEALAVQLEAGADIDALDRHGQTGLMLASSWGHATTVRWLVEHDAALDHTAKYRLSALMLAVINGHTETVRILVDAGADRVLRGSGAPGFAGLTAYDLALARGEATMVSLLGEGQRPDDPGPIRRGGERAASRVAGADMMDGQEV